jgi:hypothetical protein
MGFEGFGKRGPKKFDVEAMFEKTRRTARELMGGKQTLVSEGNDDLSNSTSEVSSSFIKDSLKILIFWLGEEK